MGAQGAAVEEGVHEPASSVVIVPRNRYRRALRTPTGRIGLFLVFVVVVAGLVGPVPDCRQPHQ